MKYRKEIDGLRAFAVLPVILFHAGSSWFEGGFVGVDVFFVISGYLITTILLAEHEAGSFSLLKFYERRARRILPALFLVMLVSIPFGWFWMTPDQLKEFCQSVLAVSVFSSNILFWLQSGYFDASAELKPLLHTWSLAVEEQYYVLFPLLLTLFWRFGRGWFGLKSLFVVIGIASMVLSQLLVAEYSSFAFYLLPTRAWELLVGAMIPLLWPMLQSSEKGLATRNVLSAIGFLLIAYSILFFDRQTPFPSVYALVPTLGAALVIRFADSQTYVARILSQSWVVGIGLISYSAYLWHQPILAFEKIRTGSPDIPDWMFAPYLALVFVLAYLSYKFVETPFRSRITVSRAQIFTIAVLGTISFGALGILGHANNGFYIWKTDTIPEEKKGMLIKIEGEKQARLDAFSAQKEYLMQPKFSQATGMKKVVVIGDSMGADLSITFAENLAIFQDYEFRYIPIANECLDELFSSMASKCKGKFKSVLDSKLLQHSDLIIVSFLWKDGADFSSIKRFLTEIKAINGKILVLGSAGFQDIASISYRIAADDSAYSQQAIDELVAKSRRGKFDEGNTKVARLASAISLPYLDRHSLYCDEGQKRCRILSLKEDSVLWDNAHLTQWGRLVTARRIDELGWLRGGGGLPRND